MARNLRRRLGRFADPDEAAERQERREAAQHRCELRMLVRVFSVLKELIRPGDDGPGLTRALRMLDAASAELTAISDTPELQAADAALLPKAGPEVYEELQSRFDRLIDAHHQGGQFNPETASPAQWLAWCIARVENPNPHPEPQPR